MRIGNKDPHGAGPRHVRLMAPVRDLQQAAMLPARPLTRLVEIEIAKFLCLALRRLALEVAVDTLPLRLGGGGVRSQLPA